MPAKFAVPEKIQRRLDRKAVPIIEQSKEIEEAWWARIWAERGLPDPATVSQEEFRQALTPPSASAGEGGEE